MIRASSNLEPRTSNERVVQQPAGTEAPTLSTISLSESPTGPARAWARLKAALTALGKIQSWIILTVFYFVLLAPVAIIFRLVTDPLRLKRANSVWRPRPAPPPDGMTWARSQS